MQSREGKWRQRGLNEVWFRWKGAKESTVATTERRGVTTCHVRGREWHVADQYREGSTAVRCSVEALQQNRPDEG